MKKIGILTCLLSNDVCTRAGCLKAYHERRDFFSDYAPDTELAVMMTCGGCRFIQEKDPVEDPGMKEKLERLQKEGIEAIHVGACRMHGGKECRRITQIIGLMEEQGLRVVRGTHAE